MLFCIKWKLAIFIRNKNWSSVEAKFTESPYPFVIFIKADAEEIVNVNEEETVPQIITKEFFDAFYSREKATKSSLREKDESFIMKPLSLQMKSI